MAVVWKAVTLGANGFRRPIAVKRIVREFRGFREVVEMFVEEARVSAALRHPNVVQVHDFGADDDGDHYLVTELVEGPHLGEWLDRFKASGTRAPWPVVTAVAVEVLRALDAAHTRRDEDGKPAPILHRDVTPPNILLDVHGIVKLADFGLARAMDRGTMTRPDVVKGKLSYLAPELIDGKAASVQSDLFSLGVILWEAMAQERLFDAPTDFEVIQKLNNPRVPLLAFKRPDLPIRLTSAIHRALERDPSRRFPTARSMLLALTGVLRVLPEPVDSPVLSASFQAE